MGLSSIQAFLHKKVLFYTIVLRNFILELLFWRWLKIHCISSVTTILHTMHRKFSLEGRLSWKKWHWLPVEVPQTQRSTWVTSRKGKRGEQAGQITSWLADRPAGRKFQGNHLIWNCFCSTCSVVFRVLRKAFDTGTTTTQSTAQFHLLTTNALGAGSCIKVNCRLKVIWGKFWLAYWLLVKQALKFFLKLTFCCNLLASDLALGVC